MSRILHTHIKVPKTACTRVTHCIQLASRVNRDLKKILRIILRLFNIYFKLLYGMLLLNPGRYVLYHIVYNVKFARCGRNVKIHLFFRVLLLCYGYGFDRTILTKIGSKHSNIMF